MKPALIALAAGAFAIGTTEFVIIGLVPGIARNLGTTLPAAGLLVSGYALAVTIGAPTVTALVGHLPRRPRAVGLMLLFALGNLLSGFASGYGAMLAGRIQGLIVGRRRDQQDYVAALEVTGIRPVIDRSFAFEELADAFRYQLSGAHFGKICAEW